MIRAALARAWREARVTVYRAAALYSIQQRYPWPVRVEGQPFEHRLSAPARAEIAADAEAMAQAMLNAERGGAR